MCALLQNISDVKHCTPVNSASGDLVVNSAPQLTAGALRMALTVTGKDAPGEKVAMGSCPMNMCTDHLPVVGAPPDQPFQLEQIPTFHAHSAPATLSAPSAVQGSRQLFGEGSTVSSRMTGTTLQGRQQSEPCILPFQCLKDKSS